MKSIYNAPNKQAAEAALKHARDTRLKDIPSELTQAKTAASQASLKVFELGNLIVQNNATIIAKASQSSHRGKKVN